MDGRYRNIAHKYSKGTRETNEVYKTLLHLMSHQFTNADSKQEIISFNIWLDDILFSAGRIESITVDSKRREINKLRKKMFEAGILSSKENLSSKLELNSKEGKKDYLLTILPTPEWGKAQKASNAKYALLRQQLESVGKQRVPEFKINAKGAVKFKRLN